MRIKPLFKVNKTYIMPFLVEIERDIILILVITKEKEPDKKEI